MKNTNNYNDPIERLFRKKADDYDISYKEEDWLKLENRLDKADQEYANRRKGWLAAAVVILLFSILGYLTYQQQQKINRLSEQLSKNKNVTNLPSNIPIVIPNNTTESDRINSNSNDNRNTEPHLQPPDLASQKLSGDEAGKKVIDDKSDGIFNIEKYKPSSFAKYTGPSTMVTTASISPGLDDLSPVISDIKPIKAEPVPKEQHTKQQEPSASTLVNSDQEPVPTQQDFSKYSLGLLAGPDISTVGNISGFASPGHNIGFSVEYNVTHDFAITIRPQRTNVRYVASGSEYQLPAGYLPAGTTPGKISAQCILIDIPISIKYDFLQFNKSRMFATAGFSSYIMLDEDYRFNYKNYQSGLPERWHEKTGTAHWMSNATISAGYELDLKRNISIRAEPFLKIPFKEVGWGNVNLYSLGSFISLNYKW